MTPRGTTRAVAGSATRTRGGQSCLSEGGGGVSGLPETHCYEHSKLRLLCLYIWVFLRRPDLRDLTSNKVTSREATTVANQVVAVHCVHQQYCQPSHAKALIRKTTHPLQRRLVISFSSHRWDEQFSGTAHSKQNGETSKARQHAQPIYLRSSCDG